MQKKCFHECLIGNDDDLELMLAIKLIAKKELKANDDGRDRFKLTYTSESINRVDLILNDTAYFNFLWSMCKTGSDDQNQLSLMLKNKQDQIDLLQTE